MRYERSGNNRLRTAAFLTAVALVLAAFTGALSSKQEDRAAPRPAASSETRHDPSLAGLSISPDAEPGGMVDTF